MFLEELVNKSGSRFSLSLSDNARFTKRNTVWHELSQDFIFKNFACFPMDPRK